MRLLLLYIVNQLRKARGQSRLGSFKELKRVVKGGKSDEEMRLEALLPAYEGLLAVWLTILRGIFHLLPLPPFQKPGQQAHEIVWPNAHLELADTLIDADILSVIGTVMREWARAEIQFDAIIKSMLVHAQQRKLLSDDLKVEMLSFKAKTIQWKRLITIVLSDKDHLLAAKNILSNAKRFSSIRNELAHWNGWGRTSTPGFLVLVENEKLGAGQIYHAIWNAEQILAVGADTAKLRIALQAFTRLLLSLAVPQLPGPLPASLSETLAELTSDTSFPTIQSYLVQRPAPRPPRKRGLPPPLSPSRV